MNIQNYIKENKLTIIVKANSSKTEITGYNEEKQALSLNVKAPAQHNKANIEIIKFFKKLLKKQVKIKKGLKNKIKIITFSF